MISLFWKISNSKYQFEMKNVKNEASSNYNSFCPWRVQNKRAFHLSLKLIEAFPVKIRIYFLSNIKTLKIFDSLVLMVKYFFVTRTALKMRNFSNLIYPIFTTPKILAILYVPVSLIRIPTSGISWEYVVLSNLSFRLTRVRQNMPCRVRLGMVRYG